MRCTATHVHAQLAATACTCGKHEKLWWQWVGFEMRVNTLTQNATRQQSCDVHKNTHRQASVCEQGVTGLTGRLDQRCA